MTDYSSINQSNYDYLWTVGISYLFCTIYHRAHYFEKDFIFTWNRGEHMNFIGKGERAQFSKESVRLYTTEFESFKSRIESNADRYSAKLDEFASKNISGFSNEELARDFSSFTDLVIKIFEDYVYLEYFCTDEVAKIVEERNPAYDIAKLESELEEAGRLKLRVRGIWNRIFYPPSVLDTYALEIGQRLALGDKVFSYKYTELIDLLNGKTVSIPDRTTVVWGKVFDGEDVVGERAEAIIRQLLNVDNSVKEFKGSVAHKGVYRGRVKKIEFSTETDFPKEIALMNKGDVLVAGSTGPEMMLACHKAGAIITDEGGIISHAAIVSRELKIPCIVGTKVATRVLKDGDMVEVDAEKGIVRILK